ncbi:MAG: hypothetical protein E7I42_14195 [Pluralibacter gergoviae]|nr:hypothetical protein [Pluralibacter gergoviae]
MDNNANKKASDVGLLFSRTLTLAPKNPPERVVVKLALQPAAKRA